MIQIRSICLSDDHKEAVLNQIQHSATIQTLRSGLDVTVNTEIFARVMRSFVKITSSRIGESTLSFTDEGNSCHSREFLRRKYVF